MKHRRPLKITSRISSVTNGFVQAILPDAAPSLDEQNSLLTALEMTPETIECVYCGNKATDWDHLRPIVSAKRPTGFLTDYRNLVPSCGPCNQSKSGQAWDVWMAGRAKNSPSSRKIPDVEARVDRLRKFAAWGAVARADLESIVGKELWDSYWGKLSEIESMMRDAQQSAAVIKTIIQLQIQADQPTE